MRERTKKDDNPRERTPLSRPVKVSASGNSWKINFPKDLQAASGFTDKSELEARAEPGRVVITQRSDSYAKTLVLGEEAALRYAPAFKELGE